MSLRSCPKCGQQTLTYFRYLLGGLGRQNHRCLHCRTILAIGGRYRVLALVVVGVIFYFLLSRVVLRNVLPAAGGMPLGVAVLFILCFFGVLSLTNYVFATWRTKE